MSRLRLALVVLGIPGLLGYGTLTVAQWRGAVAMSGFSALKKSHPQDSLKPVDPKITSRKMDDLARAAENLPCDPEPPYQNAVTCLVLAESESLLPATPATPIGSTPDAGLLGLLRDALRHINRAILLDPGHAEYHFVKATILQNLQGNLPPGTGEGAEGAVKHLLATAGLLDPYKPSLQYRIGSFWLALGGIAEAKAAFSTALRQRHSLGRDILALLWSSTSSAAELRGFIRHEPRTCVILAEFLAEHGFAAEARVEYAEASVAAASDFQVLSALVRWYLKNEDFPEVLRLVAQAEQEGRISDGRERAALSYLAGQALSREGRIQDAISAYERALQIDDTQIHLHHALALVYLRDGQYGKAIARWQFLRARFGEKSLPPNTIFVMHSGLGEAFEKQGRYMDALAEYLKAAELDPRNQKISRKIEELSGRI